MRLVILPFIALGLVLSLAVGIKYNCEGPEMFPTHYGSPFVFKRNNLGSSMEYFFSISGLILNVLIWSLFLFFIDRAIQKFRRTKVVNIFYNLVIGCLIAFTSLNIAIDSIMIGQGFNNGRNYWYWDMDKEAKDWGMKCNREFIIFEK